MTNHMRQHWKLIPAIAMMTLIFIHSSMNGDASTLESDTLIHILGVPLTDTVVIVVRKCAHLIEYIVLGASMYFVTEDHSRKMQDQDRETKSRNANEMYGPFWKAWFPTGIWTGIFWPSSRGAGLGKNWALTYDRFFGAFGLRF